jgi:hypothetical protein
MLVSIQPIPDILEAHLSVLQVAFVPHHDDGHWLSLDPAVELVDPEVQLLEGAEVGEVED